MIQTFAIAELHDEVDIGPRVNDFEETHNVGVIDSSKHINFLLDGFFSSCVGQVFLFVGLNGHNELCLLVGRPFDNCKSPSSDLQPDIEIF